MSHEQSETIQASDGKWINVYGRNTPKAGQQLPGTSSYNTVEDAIAAAKIRSASMPTEYTPEQLGLDMPAGTPPAKTEYAPEDLGFFGEAKKTLSSPKKTVRALKKSVTEGPIAEAGSDILRSGLELRANINEDPLGTLAGVGPGLLEAGTSIATGMGISAGAGLRGLYTGLTGMVSGKPFQESFMTGFNEVSKGAEDLPIHPETQAGKFFSAVIGLVPAALKTPGEVAFRVGGGKESAAGPAAAAETLSMGLALKSAVPSTTIKALRGGGGPKGKAVRDAFDELVTTDPVQARDVARGFEQLDPVLRKELDRRIDSVAITKSKQVKDIFKEAAGARGLEVPTTRDVDLMFQDARMRGMGREVEAAKAEAQEAAVPQGAPPEGVTERRAEPRMFDPQELSRQIDEVNTQRAQILNDPAKAQELQQLNDRAARMSNQLREVEIAGEQADKLLYGTPEARVNARAVSSAVQDIIDRGPRDPFKGPGRGQAGAVKLPGGMWHPEAVERLASAIEPEATVRILRDAERHGGDISPLEQKTLDRANWSAKAVKNYLNRYAGTERDPLKDVEVPFGAGTKRWEEVTDKAIRSDPAKFFTYGDTAKAQQARMVPPEEPIFNIGGYEGTQPATRALEAYLSHVGDYLRQNVAPEKLQQYDLVRAVKETAANDLRVAKEMEKAAAQSTKDLPVYKEYPDGMKWVELKLPEKLTEEQAKGIKEFIAAKDSQLPSGSKGYAALDASGREIKNSYTGDWAVGKTPEEAHLAGQLAQEGNQMGHCVGGYCEGVASGERRIFSLRDAKGKSHVTVEVEPGGKGYPGERISREEYEAGKRFATPNNILQIKGKQNRAPNPEYIPYVQDFVKSGKWGEVRDLENAGLVDTTVPTRFSPDLTPTQKNALALRFKDERYVDQATWEKALQEAPVASGLRGGPGRSQRGAIGDLNPQAALDISSVIDSLLKSFGGERSQWTEHTKANAILDGRNKAKATKDAKQKVKYLLAVETLEKNPIEVFKAGPFDPFRGPGRSQIGALNLNDLVELGESAKRSLDKAFDIGKGALRSFPGVEVAERELTRSYDILIRSVAPEALGPEARKAAAVLGSAMAKQARADSVRFYQSEPRTRFWDNKGPEVARQFRDGYESGARFADPTLEKAAQGYRNWSQEIAARDQTYGLKYDPVDNYLPHMFEDREGVSRFLQRRFGPRWNDPGFIKDRSFDMYAEAEASGFKPKFWNPEDMMLAREHASNTAIMKIEALRDMTEAGVARKLTKRAQLEVGETEWRAPNGERYAVPEHASQILHNAFNTRSLWSMEGPVGSTFRALMLAKNTIVPIKLLSLFHPIHVATMQGADALVVATKGLAADKIGFGRYTLEAIGNQYFKNLVGVSRQGYRLREVWQGKVPESQLTTADKHALQWMQEGGFIADLSPELKTNWTKSFQRSVDQGKYGSAAFKLPFYMLETVFQRPVMEVWIPSLKTASYVNAAARALEANPELLTDRVARMEAFRKIQKSVDNRFGEMQYGTTFMNRTVKDIGVGSLLSLGWQLGFLREYGGAVAETGKALRNPLELQKLTSRGALDRALFVTFYTTQAMMLGGLMTYAMTGETPKELLDYIFPRTGEVDSQGKPERVTTPYYTREFMAISKHIEQEGFGSGMAHLIGSKLSPAIGIVKAWATNLDFFGKEISNPDDPFVQRLGQKVAYTLQELEPIFSTAARRRPREMTAKDVGLGFMGFSPAPQYAIKPETEAAISSVFRRYHKAVTPYERAEYGPDNAKLREYLHAGDGEKFQEQLTMMREKYNLSSKQLNVLRKNLRADPTVKMFKALSDNQQIALLRKMPPEDQDTYLRHARPSARARFSEEP